MPQSALTPAVSVISEMVTPAILILASGSLLGTVLARLGRVVESFRKVAEAAESRNATPAMLDNLKTFQRRVDCAEAAVSAYYLAVTLFISTCLFIGLNRIVGNVLQGLPIITAVLGVSMLFVGSSYMLAECRVANRQLKREIASVWKKLEEEGK